MNDNEEAAVQRHSIIGGEQVPGVAGTLRATDPAQGAASGPEFTLIDAEQLAQATGLAAAAFPGYRRTTLAARAAFLRAAADRITASGEAIIAAGQRETGLPEARLRGELGRTTGQLRLFASVVEAGDYLGVRIEPALADRVPVPRPDLRRMLLPLGPVAVFGASNFPLAFSVAGGDTASALAAGCPVIVKAHSAHPLTGWLVGQAVSQAVSDCSLHPGTFSLVYGRGADIGQKLVADPRVRAVGFTGSRGAGIELMQIAAKREVPIPVYAEMSSVNPVIVLPGATTASREGIATGFVASLNGSAGQLCTAPGLLFVPEGAAGTELLTRVAEELDAAIGQTMLTPGICAARQRGVVVLAEQSEVALLGEGGQGSGQNAPGPVVYTTDVAAFLKNPVLAEEIFGAVCLVVKYRDTSDLLRVIAGIEGQLTATLHLNPESAADLDSARELLFELELKAGRVLVNAWPTGVDVGDAMVHGGPFPATSDGRSTSVGAAAIERFLRPVVYQGLPEALRSEALQEDNPLQLVRRVNGVFELE